MPEFDDPLKNPDNGKIVIEMPARIDSLAGIADGGIARLEAEKAKGRAVVAQEGTGNPDPVAAYAAKEDGSKPVLVHSGRRQPGPAEQAAAFQKGDKVYHKVHKEEAEVREVGIGRCRVKFKNGDKAWVKIDNIVKL